MQLDAVPSGLGSVAACGHVTPPAAAIPGLVLEHASASWIGAPSDARKLAQDERVTRTLHHGNEEAGEGITHRHERAREGSVTLEFEPASARTTAKHAIDLDESLGAHFLKGRAALCKGAED